MRNVCVVGLGSIAPLHISAIQKCKNAVLYGICDIDISKKNKIESGYDAKFYSDYDEMIFDEKIDSIHICTPHYLHYEMIEKALKAGKKVVCEKPAVMTKQELMNLKKVNEANDVCFVVQNRLNTGIVKLKELAETGELGRILGIKGILTWNRTKEYYTTSKWKGKFATEGGGVLINQAIHVLDLMAYLAGNIKSVRANSFNYSLDKYIEVEDTFSAFLKFEKDITGVFFATNANESNDNFQIGISFENGAAEYVLGKLFVNGEEVCKNDKIFAGKNYWGNSHEKLICDFYDNNVFFGFRDIENSHRAMFSMYESAKNNGLEISVL